MRSVDLGIHDCIKGKHPYTLMGADYWSVASWTSNSFMHRALSRDHVKLPPPGIGGRRGHARDTANAWLPKRVRPDTCITFVFSVTLQIRCCITCFRHFIEGAIINDKMMSVTFCNRTLLPYKEN